MKATSKVQETDIGSLRQRLDRLEKENTENIEIFGIAILQAWPNLPFPGHSSVPREKQRRAVPHIMGPQMLRFALGAQQVPQRNSLWRTRL